MEWSGTYSTTGLTHIALTVDNIKLCIQKMIEFGYNQNGNPTTSEDGKYYVFYARGPEGLIIELVQPKEKAR